MREKARLATNQADRLEATGRAQLYRAEADQLKGHAMLAHQEIKLVRAAPSSGRPENVEFGRSSTGSTDSSDRKPELTSTQPSGYADTIQPGHQLRIEVLGTTPDRPITGLYIVEPKGTVPLGPGYGRVMLLGLSLEEAEAKLKEHLLRDLSSPEVQITIGPHTTYQRGANTRDARPSQ